MVRVYSSGCFVAGVLAAQILVNIDEGGNWVREHDDVLPAEEKLKPIVSASREAPRTAPQDEEAAEMITTLEEGTEGGSASIASEGTEEKKVSDAQEPREGLSALNVTSNAAPRGRLDPPRINPSSAAAALHVAGEITANAKVGQPVQSLAELKKACETCYASRYTMRFCFQTDTQGQQLYQGPCIGVGERLQTCNMGFFNMMHGGVVYDRISYSLKYQGELYDTWGLFGKSMTTMRDAAAQCKMFDGKTLNVNWKSFVKKENRIF